MALTVIVYSVYYAIHSIPHALNTMAMGNALLYCVKRNLGIVRVVWWCDHS